MEPKKTVLETARRAAGLSQYQLARIARTSQSSVSEYESRRKSPTLEVVERLLDAADAELAVKPLVLWDVIDDPEVGSFVVPDRLWSIPVPDCFARVQVLRYLLQSEEDRIWDLSVEADRITYYELMLKHGLDTQMEDSIDGLLLVQAWPHMNLPEVIREAWQPVIDAALTPPVGPPRDPGGISARIAGEVGLPWPPKARRRQRRSPRPPSS